MQVAQCDYQILNHKRRRQKGVCQGVVLGCEAQRALLTLKIEEN
jgi:hypothetical protein